MKRAFWIVSGIALLALGSCSCPEDEVGDADSFGIYTADGVVHIDSLEPDTVLSMDTGGIDWKHYECQQYEENGQDPAYKSCNADDNACTTHFCNPATGGCDLQKATVCDDKICETGSCNTQTGECEYKPVAHGFPCEQSCFTSSFVCDTLSGEPTCVAGTCAPNTGLGDCEIVPDDKPVKIDCSEAQVSDFCQTPEECKCMNKIECEPTTGECTRPVYLPDGFGCSLDDNMCTLEKCQQIEDEGGSTYSVCTATSDMLDCSTNNSPCWTWSCNGKAGCIQTSFVEGVSCDDNNACTEDDICVKNENGGPTAGQCVGTALDIDDGNPCTDDKCANGNITHNPINGAACDDGVNCTLTQCQNGSCAIIGESPCDDGNPCTNDVCNPQNGSCEFLPQFGLPCDDGSSCTQNDECKGFNCVGTKIVCEDDNPCNGTQKCVEGECVQDLLAPNCDDGNPCTEDVCNELVSTADLLEQDLQLTAACGHAANTKPCDDGSSCTKDDICASGTCSGTPLNCDDDNLCNGVFGCTEEAGGCVEVSPGSICDDGNPCTNDFCTPQNGSCYFVPNNNPCDDGDACTLDDSCKAQSCSGTPLVCNDGDACNGTESCDSQTGCVEGTPLVCDDEDACNGLETCHSALGCQAGQPLACNDNNVCNGVETCDKIAGCKPGTPLTCNDGDVCNGLETCDPVEGCKLGTALACDDGDVCTGQETCNKTTGCVDAPDLVCNDGDVCDGLETCHPTEGCKPGTPLVCDDGNVCTGQETCHPQNGCLDAPDMNCDDGNVCTDDSCHFETGCSYINNQNPCTDNNACTIADKCEDGVCSHLSTKVCDDGNVCTSDSCDPQTGDCVFTPVVNAPCDDGDECTTVDFCNENAFCVGAVEKECPDDGDPCTLDVCIAFQGCDHPVVTCNDNNECTVDACYPFVPGLCANTPVDDGLQKPCGEDEDGDGTPDNVCFAGQCLDI